MGKIQLVIEIDDKYYSNIKESEHCGNYSVFYALEAIRNGTPLPKGHGRLIDAFECMIMEIAEELKLKDADSLYKFSTELHEHIETALQDYADDEGFGEDYEPQF